MDEGAPAVRRRRAAGAPVRDTCVAPAPPGPAPVSLARRLWEGWKRLAHRIGDFQARLLLTIVYVVVIAPFALGVRWAADPLSIKAGTARGWRDRPPPAADRRAWATRQF